MKSLVTWLLGGALAASLTWNRALLERAEAAGVATCAPSACTEPGAGCGDPAALELVPEQRRELAALCERSCRASDRLDAEADALQRELLARLGESEIDAAAARELVGRVADLRRRALESCVEGVLSVREVLTPEQVGALLGSCTSSGSSCR